MHHIKMKEKIAEEICFRRSLRDFLESQNFETSFFFVLFDDVFKSINNKDVGDNFFLFENTEEKCYFLISFNYEYF